MRNLSVFTAIVALVLVGAFASGGLGRGVAAQDATPAGEEPGIEPLFSTVLEGLPAAPIPVALARITFEPGAGLTMTANPGPALHFVEEGGFTVEMAGAGTLASGGATPEAPRPVAPGTTFEIGPGDLLTIPANTPFEVFNTGSAPAVAIIIEYFARAPGGVFPPGIALAPLVVGELTTLPPGPIMLDLFRVTVEAGAAVPRMETAGAALVYVEEGTAGYTFGEGGQVGAAAATPGAEEVLDFGDGVIDQDGSVTAVRNTGDTDLVLLSLSHHPAAEGGTPAP